MRDDIFVLNSDGTVYVDDDGDKHIDITKVIGKNYGNGWFTNCSARYRVFCGARSTKKSYNMIGYESIFKIISNPLRNIVIIRQDDVNNRGSTFEQICKCISDLGFDPYFSMCKNPLEITYKATGQKIIFRGLNNPTALNSVQFSHGYWTDIYFEEAFEITDFSAVRKVDGSLRGKLPAGYFFQVTFCFNAWNQDTWLYTEFFKGRLEDDYETLDDPNVAYMDYYDPEFIGPFGKGLYLHKSTYKCNEFRDAEVYDKVAAETKTKSLPIYQVEFLGMWGNATETVYPEWSDSLVFPLPHFIGDSNGVSNMEFADFAIGIDTGYSNGEGKKLSVKKGEDASVKIKSATAMYLCGVTQDMQKMVVIDEYYHSNNVGINEMNTDNKDSMSAPDLQRTMIETIIKWMQLYGIGRSRLMKGTINVYVDAADVGTLGNLRVLAMEYHLYNVKFYASTKLPVQSRIDFWRLMMAYGDYEVCDQCKNHIREIKNCRRAENGYGRADINNHSLDSVEYALSPLIVNLKRYKTFKQR